MHRVQRQRQLYKNTFVTPGQRKDFGQMTDGQKAMLATVQFKFDPTPLPTPVHQRVFSARASLRRGFVARFAGCGDALARSLVCVCFCRLLFVDALVASEWHPEGHPRGCRGWAAARLFRALASC
jgi:hypothetical protein